MQSSIPLCIQELGFFEGLKFYLFKKLKKNTSLRFKRLREPVFFRSSKVDYGVFMQVFVHNEYQFKLSFTPKTIFDFGANIGFASILFTNKFPEAKIWAVEPEENNYQQAKKNLENYKNVTLIKGAIWNEPTEIEIINESADSDAFMVKKSGGNKSTVRAYTTDEIFQMSGQQTIDLLKIDIEGAEKEVFELGFENWIEFTKVIVIETHDRFKAGTSKALFSTISKYDFSLELCGENLVLYNNKYIN